MTGSAAGPLVGRTIVVTRAADRAEGMAERLVELGASVVVAPTIAVVGPDDGGAGLLAAAVAAVEGRYDWLLVTSPNGAARLVDALHHAGGSGGGDRSGTGRIGGTGRTGGTGGAMSPATFRVAAIGPGSAAVLAAAGIVADLLPDRFVAEALLASFPDPPAAGGRVLLARAAVARDVLPDGLRARGWTVDVVDAYRTVGVDYDDEIRARVRSADAVAFTSSSSVQHFVEAMGGVERAVGSVPAVVVCIGPVTARTARDLGLEVRAVSERHSIEGLLRSLVDALA